VNDNSEENIAESPFRNQIRIDFIYCKRGTSLLLGRGGERGSRAVGQEPISRGERATLLRNWSERNQRNLKKIRKPHKTLTFIPAVTPKKKTGSDILWLRRVKRKNLVTSKCGAMDLKQTEEKYRNPKKASRPNSSIEAKSGGREPEVRTNGERGPEKVWDFEPQRKEKQGVCFRQTKYNKNRLSRQGK